MLDDRTGQLPVDENIAKIFLDILKVNCMYVFFNF